MDKKYIDDLLEGSLISDELVLNQEVVSTKSLDLSGLLEIMAVFFKVLLISGVIFGAFFVPFFVGVETSKLRNESTRMQIEVNDMDVKISEYNSQINALGDLLLSKKGIYLANTPEK